jgi:hypothetical protein
MDAVEKRFASTILILIILIVPSCAEDEAETGS